MRLIAGNSNLSFAQEVAACLNIPLASTSIRRFADKEIFVEIQESVRGEDVYVLQSTSSPANDHLMELLITIDTLKRSSAQRITAILPYFGYARQDRPAGPGSPISAKLVANILTSAGADQVITIDLHSPQTQGFFDIPLNNISPVPAFSADIEKKYKKEDLIIVAPDTGGVVRSRALAAKLGVPIAICDKRREKPGSCEILNIIGDVQGKSCLLLDDIIDSGNTLIAASKALIDAGATSVSAYVTHAVLSGNACQKVLESPLKELVVTNTIDVTEKLEKSEKIRHISLAPMIAQVIGRVSQEESVSSLFN